MILIFIFIKVNCPSVDIHDMVLIAESPQNLQKMLDTLYDYCNEWKLEVNVQKTIKLWYLEMEENYMYATLKIGHTMVIISILSVNLIIKLFS